ncbi:unnamed protein product [Rotaria socialis]
MYVLTPPLFELLAKHIQLTNSKLARQYPSVHYGLLKTLNSHCAAVLCLENHKPSENRYSTLNLFFLNNYLVYSNEEEIGNLCCRLLNKIVKRQRDLDVSFLVRIVKQNPMNSPYLGIFITHYFNLILGSTLVNHQMPQINNESSKHEHLSEDQHRLLNYEKLPNFGNDALKPYNFLLAQLITTGKKLKLFFFITNKSTCCEWLNRFRIPIILTALRTGQYESAARNSNQYLLHTCSLGQAEVSEFEFVIISFVQSLIKLHNSMTIHGIYVWLKNIHQLDWSWIQACEHEAAENLEQAAYEYKLFLNEHFKSLSIINEKKTR